MRTERTLEFYGFVKGDTGLVRAGLRVRILDENFVERTDPSEIFYTKLTPAGVVYQIRALGDNEYTDPEEKTGLNDGEKFYIVFQREGIDVNGFPARTESGELYSFSFQSSPVAIRNIDIYLRGLEFDIKPAGGTFIDRPNVVVATDEPDCFFLITTNGLDPVLGQSWTYQIPSSGVFPINRDGEFTLKITGIDKFGNPSGPKAYPFNVAYPTVKLLESLTLQEVKSNLPFYPVYYTVDSTNRYTELPISNLKLDDPATDLTITCYVEFKPGIVNGIVFGPRYTRIAKNRNGTITYRVVRNDETPGPMLVYPEPGTLLNVDAPKTEIQFQFVDEYSVTTGLHVDIFRVVHTSPIIEQVIVNSGESPVSSPLVYVSVLAKGTVPQMITIGQNPDMVPVVTDDPVTVLELGVPCEAGGIDGYQAVGTPNFCVDSCTNVVHTAFNITTPFTLLDQDGEQFIYVRVRSYTGTGFATVRVSVVLNTDLPYVTLQPSPEAITQSSNRYTFYGTKLPNTDIYLNGQLVIPANASTVFQYEVPLVIGENSYTFKAKDVYNRWSTEVTRKITYEYKFEGVTSAVVKVNELGNWEVPYVGLPLGTENSSFFDIVVELLGENISTATSAVLVVDYPMTVEIISPTPYAPVANCEQYLLFNLVDPSAKTFFGPYYAAADEFGNWEIDAVVVNPALYLNAEVPNTTVIVEARGQNGTLYQSTSDVYVQIFEKVAITLDGSIVYSESNLTYDPKVGIPLGKLKDGKHEIVFTATDALGYISTTKAYFIVDTAKPVVTITSPKPGVLITTAEPPVLEYTIQSNVPLLNTQVFVDGVNYGAISSGQKLPPCASGPHTVVVRAETMARCEGVADGYSYGYGPKPASGAIGSAETNYTHLCPVVIDNVTPEEVLQLNIGSNINKELQGESAIEELRILNIPSTDADILNDWRLLMHGIRFQNASTASLTVAEQLIINQNQLEASRISLPKNTLVLNHFDNDYQSVVGVDNRPKDANGNIEKDADGNYIETENGLPLDLRVVTMPIIDQTVATNQLAIDIYYHKNDRIDRALIKESIDRVIPARSEALVTFETVNEA